MIPIYIRSTPYYNTDYSYPASAGWNIIDLHQIDPNMSVNPSLARRMLFAAQMMQRKMQINATYSVSHLDIIESSSAWVMPALPTRVWLCLARPAASLVSPSENKTAACRTNTSLLSYIVVLAAAQLQTLPLLLAGCCNPFIVRKLTVALPRAAQQQDLRSASSR